MDGAISTLPPFGGTGALASLQYIRWRRSLPELLHPAQRNPTRRGVRPDPNQQIRCSGPKNDGRRRGLLVACGHSTNAASDGRTRTSTNRAESRPRRFNGRLGSSSMTSSSSASESHCTMPVIYPSYDFFDGVYRSRGRAPPWRLERGLHECSCRRSLIGRPNVGKSALFNRTRRRTGSPSSAMKAGTTRDRHFAEAEWNRQMRFSGSWIPVASPTDPRAPMGTLEIRRRGRSGDSRGGSPATRRRCRRPGVHPNGRSRGRHASRGTEAVDPRSRNKADDPQSTDFYTSYSNRLGAGDPVPVVSQRTAKNSGDLLGHGPSPPPPPSDA
jgi:hypothetical protein